MTAPDTDAPEVPTRPCPEGSVQESVFTPSARFVAEHQVKALCLVVAVAVPLLSLWLVLRTTEELHQSTWVYSVDGAGTIHYGPVTPADARSALFREILLQATQACFTRNPSGLSYPEVARRIFVGDSWRMLQAQVREEAPERRRRNLYDHPEVEGIDVLEEGEHPRYRVRGFIVRSGAVEGLPYQPPAAEFHLLIELSAQTDAMESGRYPFVVTRHRAAVRWTTEGGSP